MPGNKISAGAIADMSLDLWNISPKTIMQVQNQDPISPSGRGRHNTGKDGKVYIYRVIFLNFLCQTGKENSD